VQVLKTLAQAAFSGIFSHDWQIGNVGFPDAENCKCVIVAWKKISWRL
jgi:hypothetical protein